MVLDRLQTPTVLLTTHIGPGLNRSWIIPIPIAHGMTVGELATMMLGENALMVAPMPVEVIPMKHYAHG